jgi:uncharacterized protein YukE
MHARFIFTVIPVLILFLSGCQSKEIEKLRSENDSLRQQLETRYSAVVVMRDVAGLLDSIDDSRNVLKTDLDKGTSYENFSARLQSINQYVKRSEDKITDIQKKLRSAKGESAAYLMMVDALKGELEIRAVEIQKLEATVATFQEENKGLIQTVKLQDTEMSSMRTNIETKQQELSLLEAKVDEMVEAFKVSEADSYFSRAQAIEEAANRTKLAPKKKKETYKESLELYKKSLSLGNTKAQSKIDLLEKKIK